MLLQGRANSALSKGMQGTAIEKKRESVNRSVQFHFTANTGHVQAGLTRIIKGFNGENLRESKCAAEYVTEKDRQTETTETDRHTHRPTVES